MTTTEPVIRTPFDHMEPNHSSDYECVACGAPESASSMSGCRNCDSQDDIVPRGTYIALQRQRWLWKHGHPVDTPMPPPEEVEVDRSHSFDHDRAILANVELQLLQLLETRGQLRMRLIIDCYHEYTVIEAFWRWPLGGSAHNRLCLRCGLDLMNTGDPDIIKARKLSRSLRTIPSREVRRVEKEELFKARDDFPQPLDRSTLED